jgi:ParB/RepB/Spo0J family partition protein
MGLDVRDIALDKLSISALNVRKDPGDLTGLISSITDVGVLEPIVVWPMGEGYEVIAGSRRTAAAREAGLKTIPASVLELTEVQAILTSLIENIQRKDLTLVERVETYQQLEALEPAYRKKAALAKVVGGSPQKIGQELQAYEIALALQPFGIRVESHFRFTSPERQRGDVLPEYHAVLLHQASAWLRAKDVIPDDRFVALQVEWARRIAPHSQEKAEEIIAHLKATVDSYDKLISGQDAGSIIPAQDKSSQQNPAPQQHNPDDMWEKDTGAVTCQYCEQELRLIHVSDNTHHLRQESTHPKDQLELPGLYP